jgi:hypothetical protein
MTDDERRQQRREAGLKSAQTKGADRLREAGLKGAQTKGKERLREIALKRAQTMGVNQHRSGTPLSDWVKLLMTWHKRAFSWGPDRRRPRPHLAAELRR